VAKKPSKAKQSSKKPAPEKPQGLFPQNQEDAMKRAMNAGRPNAPTRPHLDVHTKPHTGKPIGQPRQRGRRV
jgi:hypothetical protein